MSTSAEGLPAVVVDSVSKQFRVPREQVHTLKERVLHPLRSGGYETFDALTDVSFSVQPGEFFGIVGRNGSGKSTLLKCLAGIYRADDGEIYVNGRLSSFIELGVGFNPDLAARENVILNALMLGLSPADARQPLYSPGAFPAYAKTVALRDPLVIPNCIVQFDQRQIVSAETDGTIL